MHAVRKVTIRRSFHFRTGHFALEAEESDRLRRTGCDCGSAAVDREQIQRFARNDKDLGVDLHHVLQLRVACVALVDALQLFLDEPSVVRAALLF